MTIHRLGWKLLFLFLMIFGATSYAFYKTKPLENPLIDDNYQLIWHACDFPLPEALSVDCATLITPERTGGFQLPVAIIRYTGMNKREDALVYLQGGPGAGAGINKSGMINWQYFEEFLNAKRDIILLDRRGTGGSVPKLKCAAYKRYNEKILRQRLKAKNEITEGFAVVQKCFARQKNFNINHYGTKLSAEDIRALVSELALPAWNILGVSYGTRLAMEVVAGAPSADTLGLKALVLDSVFPPEVGGAKAWPNTLNRALQRFFLACDHHVPCAKAWQEKSSSFTPNNLQASLQEVLATLKQVPMHTTVTRLNEWPLNLVVNDHLFLSAVFSASYDRHRWQDVISAMHGVKLGKKEPVKKLMTSYVNQVLSGTIADLVFMAVDCQDNAMGTAEEYYLQVAMYSYLTPYIEGLWENQVCHLWGSHGAELSLQALRAKKIEIPTLILAGVYDPITPVEWARTVARLWPHAQIQEFKNTGHAVLGTNACALEALSEFLDAPQLPWHACPSKAL